MINTLEQSFSKAAPLTSRVGNSLLLRAVLCTAASLISSHKMPRAHLPLVDNEKISPDAAECLLGDKTAPGWEVLPYTNFPQQWLYRGQLHLVAQTVKIPPAMQETWVQSLDWEDPLEEGTHSSILAWRILMDRGAWRATVREITKSQTRLSNFHFTHTSLYYYLQTKSTLSVLL